MCLLLWSASVASVDSALVMQLATAADEVSSAARSFSVARAERDAAQGEQRRLRANLQKVCVLASWRRCCLARNVSPAICLL